jgi:hypothetical protein
MNSSLSYHPFCYGSIVDTKRKDLLMSKSEIARLRERLALEEQTMRLGFSGPAAVASHAAINARMQRGAERILKLIEEHKADEALALMNTETWGAEGE